MMKTPEMFPHVTDAKYLDAYKVWLRFNDGTEGEVDLAGELDGEFFEPLKDIGFFKTFVLDGHTLAWSNGADFAPEFLLEKIAGGMRTSMVAESGKNYGES